MARMVECYGVAIAVGSQVPAQVSLFVEQLPIRVHVTQNLQAHSHVPYWHMRGVQPIRNQVPQQHPMTALHSPLLHSHGSEDQRIIPAASRPTYDQTPRLQLQCSQYNMVFAQSERVQDDVSQLLLPKATSFPFPLNRRLDLPQPISTATATHLE